VAGNEQSDRGRSQLGVFTIADDRKTIFRFSGISHRPDRFRSVMNILAFGVGNLGGPDLFIILLIVLVLFGAKKLPDLARSLGQSMNEFRKAREDVDRELHNASTQPSGGASLPVHASPHTSRTTSATPPLP
jgi:sec-independent protein translocase protein TatA